MDIMAEQFPGAFSNYHLEVRFNIYIFFLHFLLFLVHMKKPDQTQKAATMFDLNLSFLCQKWNHKVGDPHRSAACLTNPKSGLIFNQAT